MSFLSSLLNALPGAVAQGLIWGLMAIGVYITFRILDVADLTVDGSLATGGAVAVMLITGRSERLGCALLCAVLAGMLAGFVTGLLHTNCGIPAILAGILTQLSLVLHQPADHGQQGQSGTLRAWTSMICWYPSGMCVR